MEYVGVACQGIGLLRDTWASIKKFYNYKEILDESMLTLKTKIEMLSSQEADINTELKEVEHADGKKQKREVANWLKTVQDRKNKVQQIEQKASKRRCLSRLQFLRLVEKNIQEVDKLIEQGGFTDIVINVHEDREGVLPTTQLVGQTVKERKFNEIWECLMNDKISSIGVYGMGGVGKTTIVTHIHNRLLESSSNFAHVYWVTVSQESSIHKLQDSIAKVLRVDLSDEPTERRAAKLIKELEARRKFVLILDDMWEVFPTDEVGIPIGVNGGKLILTTRLLEVCRRMSCQQIIKVKPLLVEEAWQLFMEKLGRETILTPEVETIAKSIAEECAGLPLAIITTAGSMRGVNDIREWRDALNNLKELTKGLINMEEAVYRKLKFSYDRLKDETFQQCFLYCALFPEDYKIKREHLIVCWIAEGLIDGKKTRQAKFDRGHTLLNKLEYVCLLEHTKDDDGQVCVKMHDVIRDMALNITKENHQFMVKAGIQLTELPSEREWSESLERVSLMHNNIEGQLSNISPKCPRLHTLMLQSNSGIQWIPDSLFLHMQHLKVLDLSFLWKLKCLPDSISNLEKLRALLLNNCDNLRYVPSLVKLADLRELDLRHTSIQELPDGMEKLVDLKRLDFYKGGVRNVFPSGVLPSPSCIQHLRLDNCEMTNDAHMEELVSWRQLEVIGITFSNLHMFNSYVKTQHWQRLNFYFLRVGSGRYYVGDNTLYCRRVDILHSNLIGEQGSLALPANVQELAIDGCHDFKSLYDVSSSLKNVKELERCWIGYCSGVNHFWPLSIPSAEEESQGCTSTDTSLFLQSLRTLRLNNLENLSVVCKGVRFSGALSTSRGAFSNLKLFTLGQCPNIKYVFMRGLVHSHLQNLEAIVVYDCENLENIIVDEEDEEEEEKKDVVEGMDERDHHYNDNNIVITCPKLRSLELENLKKLKSIWRGTMACHSLQQIQVVHCPMLKRLPFSMHANGDGPTSLPLKKISGGQEWWNLLEWEHHDVKCAFQPLFHAATEVL